MSQSDLVILYIHPLSHLSRAVLMVAAALNIKPVLKMINIMTGEHKRDEYKLINPNQTVPTMIHKNIKLIQSREMKGFNYILTK